MSEVGRASTRSGYSLTEERRTGNAAIGGVRRPGIAIAAWLLQLTLPTLALIPVVSRINAHQIVGVYTATLLGLALAWYAFCLLALTIDGVRRWILTHPVDLIVLFASTVLSLVALEMFYRSRVESLWGKKSTTRYPSTNEYSRELGWKPARGKDGVGEHGWRGPYPTTAKPGGCFRIVCVGDSATYGLHCPWEEAWPHQLETLLNADSAWTTAHGKTEVVNLGVCGYGTDQELLALKTAGLSLHPDVVILHLYVNDFADVSYDHNWRMSGHVTRYYKPCYALERGRLVLKRDSCPLPRHLSGRLYNSNDELSFGLSSVVLYKVGELLDRHDAARPRGNDGWPIHSQFHAEYVQSRPLVWALVSEIAAASRQAGSRFLVTLTPCMIPNGPTDEPPLRVGSFLQDYQADAASVGVPAINCIAEYFVEGGAARFASAKDLIHLNAQGNALVARHTMTWLEENIPATR